MILTTYETMADNHLAFSKVPVSLAIFDQTKAVKVHIPMAIHPVLQDKSYDRNLDALLEGKRWMSQNLFAPPVEDDVLGKLLK